MDTPGHWILLVEDDPLLARTLTRTARLRFGVELVTAEDPEAAVESLEARRDAPAAVLLDLCLGGDLSGVDVLVALQHKGLRSPCAFWSSSPRARVLAELTTHGLRNATVFDKLEMRDVLDWLKEVVDASADQAAPR